MVMKVTLEQINVNNDMKPVNQQIRDIKSYLYQLINELEVAFTKLSADNFSESYQSELMEEIKLPKGTIVLRTDEKPDGGFSYGKWQNIGKAQLTDNTTAYLFQRTE